VTKLQQITVEELEERIETGPLQINDDWPGTFIRGDNAAYYALMLGELLTTRKEDDYESFSSTIAWTVMKSLYGVLRSSNANRITEHEHTDDEDVGC
jgi:hypothetical protein